MIVTLRRFSYRWRQTVRRSDERILREYYTFRRAIDSYSDMAHFRSQGTPRPLHALPECQLVEITRVRVIGGQLIDYQGSDGNIYHQFVGRTERIWLITVIAGPSASPEKRARRSA